MIKLRDYQKRLIGLMSDEIYDEVSDTIIPKNRRIVVMQSRQTGKCVTGNTMVDVVGKVDDSQLSFCKWFNRQLNRFLKKKKHTAL